MSARTHPDDTTTFEFDHPTPRLDYVHCPGRHPDDTPLGILYNPRDGREDAWLQADRRVFVEATP